MNPMNKKAILLIAMMAGLTGCVSHQTYNAIVNTQQLPALSKLCIQENNAIDPSKEYLNIIVNRFETNKINTQVYAQQKPSNCKYTLTYDIKKSDDNTVAISKASLHLFDNGLQIHTAQYNMNDIFVFDKNKAAKDKLEPLVDQLSVK